MTSTRVLLRLGRETSLGRLVRLGVACLYASGCHSSRVHGPVMDLYLKAGGPAFEKSPGVYDPQVVNAFFLSHTNVLPRFIDHGVCSLKTEPSSEEATVNGIICQSAASVSWKKGMEEFQKANQ